MNFLKRLFGGGRPENEFLEKEDEPIRSDYELSIIAEQVIEVARDPKNTEIHDFPKGLKEWPDSIGELTHLKSIFSWFTLLTTLPETVGQLTNLEYLDVSGNRLEYLPEILDQKEYPKKMHLYLLDLMRKFELCYEFYDGDGHYLVPELLGKEEPDLQEFAKPDALRFEYRYNVLLEGLLPRFIVRSRALNKNLPRWRSGVVLTWDGNRAVVKADVQDRRVSIVVIGPVAGRRRLLSVIRADLEHIHRSIAKLQATEQVPVPGHSGLIVDYATLCVMESECEAELKLVHNGKMVKVKISDLLGGLEEPHAKPRETMLEAAGREAVRVAFSYSHKDEELRDQLETHLKLLQRQEVISTWHDRKILGGENWAGVIDENFKRGDLILLLVSADFLASDYCVETEMKLALEREAKGEARVVPVLLRACDWKGALFGKLQGFPKDMKPVTSWANRDEAWIDVAAGIRKVAASIQEKRK